MYACRRKSSTLWTLGRLQAVEMRSWAVLLHFLVHLSRQAFDLFISQTADDATVCDGYTGVHAARGIWGEIHVSSCSTQPCCLQQPRLRDLQEGVPCVSLLRSQGSLSMLLAQWRAWHITSTSGEHPDRGARQHSVLPQVTRQHKQLAHLLRDQYFAEPGPVSYKQGETRSAFHCIERKRRRMQPPTLHKLTLGQVELMGEGRGLLTPLLTLLLPLSCLPRLNPQLRKRQVFLYRRYFGVVCS